MESSLSQTWNFYAKNHTLSWNARLRLFVSSPIPLQSLAFLARSDFSCKKMKDRDSEERGEKEEWVVLGIGEKPNPLTKGGTGTLLVGQ